MIRWDQVNAVQLKRISPVWYRLRLGWADYEHGELSRVTFDAGVRVTDGSVEDVRRSLQARIAAWH